MSALILSLDDLSKSHASQIVAIVEILRMEGPMTRCELERVGHWRPNQVSGRVHEALERGLLVRMGETKCEFHEARGSVELLDVAPHLRDRAGVQHRLETWGVVP